MRILFLNHNVAGTGTYQRCSNLARGLAARGHEVVLVTTSRTARVEGRWSSEAGGRLRILEAPDVFWGRGRTGWDPINVARRIAALRSDTFELIHAFDCRPVVILPALALQRRTGAALFIDWADWWGRGGRIRERSGWLVRLTVGPIEAWFEEAFRARALATTVVSAALRERSLRLGIPAERILHIGNGCDPSLIRPMDRGEARVSLGISPEVPLLGYLGTATPGEMRLACDALERVRRVHPAARLVLLGATQTAPPRSLEHAGAVQRTGFVPFDRLALWLGALDLTLLPLPDTLGNRGRWPGKINDYLSAGRAVVATRVGDAARLVEEGDLGRVAAPDAEHLAIEILALLADGAARERCGRAARSLAETTLSWSVVAARLDEYYAEQLRARTDGRGTPVGGG